IWVYPPSTSLLSSDLECLKWQAYLALGGLDGICVRSDVDAQGTIGNRLPNA
ncbi:hypothetical protein BDP27DRAFT_1250119, partial [Rhodocollybia butyracea]